MIETYLIQKKGYVGNCLEWWAQGDRGYVMDINKAREFTLEEATSIVTGKNSDKVMHKKSDILAIGETHVNSESSAWRNYNNKIHKND